MMWFAVETIVVHSPYDGMCLQFLLVLLLVVECAGEDDEDEDEDFANRYDCRQIG